jgi:murein DD-endopeptidase MepM/ murein hydrolase activator NlpD
LKGITTDLKAALPEFELVKKRDQKLRKACEDFESVFTYQLLRSMRKTIDKCDLFHGGSGEEIYESLLDQELAKSMAGRGAKSLAEILYQELRHKDVLLSPETDIPQTQEMDREPKPPAFPINGRISSPFGWRNDPINGEKKFHKGIDLAAEEGTVIRASMAGRVLISDFRKGYGNVVVLDHGSGFTTLYAHNKDNMVQEGEWIQAGASIGKVGSTGRSTGPHLHFEVRRHGRHMDPEEFLGIGRDRGSAMAASDHLRSGV